MSITSTLSFPFLKTIPGVDCEIGRYAPVPFEGGCLECSPGFETDNRTGATSCTACDAGKFSTNATAWQCLPCAEGRSSTSGQPECDSCEAGRFQALSGQGSCETCSVGKVAPASGSMVCSECEPGKAQRASGQEQCEKCAEGKFSGAEGSSACEPCGIEYDSKEGSEVCDIAASGHYLEKPIDIGTWVSRECPPHAFCPGGRKMPAPIVGFWVDRRKVEYSQYIYRCLRSTCTGSNSDVFDDDANDGGGDERGEEEEEGRRLAAAFNGSCWSIEAYDFSWEGGGRCNQDVLMCSEGAKGPLCNACMDGYTFNSALSSCMPCGSDATMIPLALASALGFLGLAVLALQWRGVKLDAYLRLSVLKLVDTGTLKILWSTMQIVSSVQWNLSKSNWAMQEKRHNSPNHPHCARATFTNYSSSGVKFPAPFSDFLAALSFLQFDFLTLDCISGNNSFYHKVYVTMFLPLLLLVAIAVVGALRALLSGLRADALHTIFNQTVYLTLFLSYIGELHSLS